MKKVIKKDGSIEDFDKAKVLGVTTAAGLTSEQAQALAENVEKYVAALPGEKVTSQQIRDKVVEELTKIDEYIASLYVFYEKTKETTTPAP